jgi:hypothetical protein
MLKAACRHSSMCDNPIRGPDRILQRPALAGYRAEHGQSIDGPTVFSRVDVFVHPRDAELSAFGVP